MGHANLPTHRPGWPNSEMGHHSDAHSGVRFINALSERLEQLEAWFQTVLTEYADCILPMDEEIAQLWGRLRVPHPAHALDKQIAATALIHSLTVVTRNQRDFEATGVGVLNPFEKAAPCGGTNKLITPYS